MRHQAAVSCALGTAVSCARPRRDDEADVAKNFLSTRTSAYDPPRSSLMHFFVSPNDFDQLPERLFERGLGECAVADDETGRACRVGERMLVDRVDSRFRGLAPSRRTDAAVEWDGMPSTMWSPPAIPRTSWPGKKLGQQPGDEVCDGRRRPVSSAGDAGRSLRTARSVRRRADRGLRRAACCTPALATRRRRELRAAPSSRDEAQEQTSSRSSRDRRRGRARGSEARRWGLRRTGTRRCSRPRGSDLGLLRPVHECCCGVQAPARLPSETDAQARRQATPPGRSCRGVRPTRRSPP